MNSGPDMRRVSNAYRDIAKETSPAEIDDRVMALARQEARTRYGLARTWIRPVAWAATIALSFAFILELSYFRDATLPPDLAAPPAMDSDTGERVEPALQEAPFKRSPATIIAAPEVRTHDARPLRETEKRTDTTTSDLADEPPPSASSRPLLPDEGETDIKHCTAEAQQSAVAWYSCVVALRDQGLHDAAKAEFDALREAYPGFSEPAAK